MRGRFDNPSYQIIADPASLRWRYYERDLLRFWREHRREPNIELLPWRDVIAQRGELLRLIKRCPPALLRIESLARDPALLVELARAGGEAELLEAVVSQPPGLDGLIVSPRLVYQGFSRVLDGIRRSLGCCRVLSTADPAHIAVLFDKNATSARLSDAGIPTPASFRPAGSAKELFAELRRRDWQRAYIKLAHGSCASGIARLDLSHEKPVALTTMLRIDGRYYNTLRLQQLYGRDLEQALDFVIEEGATAQREIAKPQIGSHNFDIRVVVIRGKISATIVRVSSHPMTNLHLGGWRGDVSACRRLVPQRQWLDAMDYCVEAAGLFDVPAVGVDLVFKRHSFQPYILELNAFGDFVRNWRDAQGRSIYSLEIESTAKAYGLIETANRSAGR